MLSNFSVAKIHFTTNVQTSPKHLLTKPEIPRWRATKHAQNNINYVDCSGTASIKLQKTGLAKYHIKCGNYLTNTNKTDRGESVREYDRWSSWRGKHDSTTHCMDSILIIHWMVVVVVGAVAVVVVVVANLVDVVVFAGN